MGEQAKARVYQKVFSSCNCCPHSGFAGCEKGDVCFFFGYDKARTVSLVGPVPGWCPLSIAEDQTKGVEHFEELVVAVGDMMRCFNKTGDIGRHYGPVERVLDKIEKARSQ